MRVCAQGVARNDEEEDMVEVEVRQRFLFLFFPEANTMTGACASGPSNS